MRQISSAEALLIFNPGNIGAGKTGTVLSVDVGVGYLCGSSSLCLFPRDVSMSSALSIVWQYSANTEAEVYRQHTRLKRQTLGKASIFPLYPLITVQSACTVHAQYITRLFNWCFDFHSSGFLSNQATACSRNTNKQIWIKGLYYVSGAAS